MNGVSSHFPLPTACCPKKSVFIAVPAYGDISPPTLISLFRARDEAREAGWQKPQAESFGFIRMVLSDAATV